MMSKKRVMVSASSWEIIFKYEIKLVQVNTFPSATETICGYNALNVIWMR